MLSLLAVISAALFCIGAGLQPGVDIPVLAALGSPEPAPSPFVSPSALSASSSATPSASPLPPTPRPPRDAPALRVTTPPFVARPPHPAPSVPDMLWLAQGDVISVPLQTVSQRALVQVVLNGHPTQFLLDTSAPQTLVDAAALSGPRRAQADQLLQIGELRFLHVHTARTAIRSYAQTYLGVSADGIIGADLLAHHPVAIDYAASSFTIYRNSQAAALARSPRSIVMPLIFVGNVPAVPVTVEGQSIGMFALDTGSSMDFEVRPGALLAKHVTLSHTLPELREARVGAAVSGKTARASEAQIGAIAFDHPLVAMPDQRIMSLPDGIAGMVGGGLLQRMSLLIDEPGQIIAFAPLSDAVTSTYDRSGAWLVLHHGQVVVHNVLAGSPAAMAGLGIGDELLKLDGAPSVNLEDVRRAFTQAAGTRVPLTYRRGRRTNTTTVVLRNLL